LHAFGAAPPTRDEILSMTEATVLTRDWSQVTDPRNTKFTAHVTVSPPCLIDHVGVNRAAAVLLSADLEITEFPASVDLGIYGGVQLPQLRAPGVGPVVGTKPAMVPWGRWRQSTGWERLSADTATAALKRAMWITDVGVLPIARAISAAARVAVDHARRVLTDAGRRTPSTSEMLTRTAMSTRKSQSVNTYRLDANRVATAMSGIVRRIRPEWSGFQMTRVKIDFETPYNYKFLLSGSTSYCGIKDAAHRNAVGSDKAWFVVAMHRNARPDRIKHRCKHSECADREVPYDMTTEEIETIEVRLLRPFLVRCVCLYPLPFLLSFRLRVCACT